MTFGPGVNAATGRMRSACRTRNWSATSPRPVRPIHAPGAERHQRDGEDAAGRDRGRRRSAPTRRARRSCGARSRRPARVSVELGGEERWPGPPAGRRDVGVQGERQPGRCSAVKPLPSTVPVVSADGRDGECRRAAGRADLGVVAARAAAAARVRVDGDGGGRRPVGHGDGGAAGEVALQPSAAVTDDVEPHGPADVGQVRTGHRVREGHGQVPASRVQTVSPVAIDARRVGGAGDGLAGVGELARWVTSQGARARSGSSAAAKSTPHADRRDERHGPGAQRDLAGAGPGGHRERTGVAAARRGAAPAAAAGPADGAGDGERGTRDENEAARRARARRAPCRRCGMPKKRRPRISSCGGRSSSSQSLLSPWVTKPSASPETIRCMTIGVEGLAAVGDDVPDGSSCRPSAGSPGPRCGTGAPCWCRGWRRTSSRRPAPAARRTRQPPASARRRR